MARLSPDGEPLPVVEPAYPNARSVTSDRKAAPARGLVSGGGWRAFAVPLRHKQVAIGDFVLYQSSGFGA